MYRLPLLAYLSIAHRATGIALSVGTLLVVYWFVALGSGKETFEAAQGFFGHFIVQFALFGWTLALFYHMGNGIRHLFWDAGYGFKLADADRSGHIVLGAAGILTLLVWLIAIFK